MKKGMVLAVLLVGALLALTVSLYLRESADTPQTITLGPGDSLVARYMNGMRTELIAFSKKHPILKGIEQDPGKAFVPLGSVNFFNFACNNEKTLQRSEWLLDFGKNTVLKEGFQFDRMVPTTNGIHLFLAVSPSVVQAVPSGIVKEHWELQRGTDELHLTYGLMLGENVKHLEAPIRKIVRGYLQALRDEILKQGGWVESEDSRHL